MVWIFVLALLAILAVLVYLVMNFLQEEETEEETEEYEQVDPSILGLKTHEKPPEPKPKDTEKKEQT